MTYDWNAEKNRQLKERRGISLGEIVLCIQEDRGVTVLEHPNKVQYPGQRLYLMEYKQRRYAVAFVLSADDEVLGDEE